MFLNTARDFLKIKIKMAKVKMVEYEL